jgi:hypothetical protein
MDEFIKIPWLVRMALNKQYTVSSFVVFQSKPELSDHVAQNHSMCQQTSNAPPHLLMIANCNISQEAVQYQNWYHCLNRLFLHSLKTSTGEQELQHHF